MQQTWLYFCRNICEATTGERYNPDRASLITWLNNYLKRRLQDVQIGESQAKRDFVPAQVRGKDGETIDVIEQQPAPPDIPPILEDLRRWAETDADGTLTSTHIKGHPQVNCQLLILRRLPPETSWELLSKELGIAIPTLSAFYQRKCMPKLHNFAESEGYV
ncbi:sigma-70 family RNA polymerase sigma factor [Chamaesiphon sp. VAR_48_metabat_403]|uniref:sigma-70 family RNA polymerase sigma factor n=1 Tax=Chamaesiphon sp. VAR_48_metabat_403 TaxID=2964700 RepID=UPI00286E01E6|nr:sigma-70 family RNA polymerase sigma factor [Chamaesiphon sp. VAR_48_metabat_403]